MRHFFPSQHCRTRILNLLTCFYLQTSTEKIKWNLFHTTGCSRIVALILTSTTDNVKNVNVKISQTNLFASYLNVYFRQIKPETLTTITARSLRICVVHDALLVYFNNECSSRGFLFLFFSSIFE